MSPRPCPDCGAPLRSSARFCADCGHRLGGGHGADARRALLAVALLFIGVLSVLLAHAFWLPEPESGRAIIGHSLLATGGFCAVAALVLPILGRGAWSDSLAGPAEPRDLGLGLVVGVAGWVVSVGYVFLLSAIATTLVEEGEPPDPASPGPVLAVQLFVYVVLPALSEEWTDRGVLWTALRRITGVGPTIFCTAMLFGFMHGLNGAGLFEVPHRFAVGLALGWLRARTDSLWPGIVAHACLNTLAVCV